MIATSFAESNAYLDSPANMSPEQCHPLSVARTQMTDGTYVIISCYKLTSDEVEEFRRTGRIWMIVAGDLMPPIALTAINPFLSKPESENND